VISDIKMVKLTTAVFLNNRLVWPRTPRTNITAGLCLLITDIAHTVIMAGPNLAAGRCGAQLTWGSLKAGDWKID